MKYLILVLLFTASIVNAQVTRNKELNEVLEFVSYGTTATVTNATLTPVNNTDSLGVIVEYIGQGTTGTCAYTLNYDILTPGGVVILSSASALASGSVTGRASQAKLGALKLNTAATLIRWRLGTTWSGTLTDSKSLIRLYYIKTKE